jgi:hypothetical protein
MWEPDLEIGELPIPAWIEPFNRLLAFLND